MWLNICLPSTVLGHSKNPEMIVKSALISSGREIDGNASRYEALLGPSPTYHMRFHNVLYQQNSMYRGEYSASYVLNSQWAFVK